MTSGHRKGVKVCVANSIVQHEDSGSTTRLAIRACRDKSEALQICPLLSSVTLRPLRITKMLASQSVEQWRCEASPCSAIGSFLLLDQTLISRLIESKTMHSQLEPLWRTNVMRISDS
jgi:hypothetical protein